MDIFLLKIYLFTEKAEENTQKERLNRKEVLELAEIKSRFHFYYSNLSEIVIRKPRNGDALQVLLVSSFLF